MKIIDTEWKHVGAFFGILLVLALIAGIIFFPFWVVYTTGYENGQSDAATTWGENLNSAFYMDVSPNTYPDISGFATSTSYYLDNVNCERSYAPGVHFDPCQNEK